LARSDGALDERGSQRHRTDGAGGADAISQVRLLLSMGAGVKLLGGASLMAVL
jgi:hypothetical protein